ncbi:MAG: RNA polymerase sigma factor [Actinomycetota bacterium]
MSGDLEARAASGDIGAFGSYIRACDARLRGVAWAVVRDAHATDDVMQSAYEKAFRSLADFDARSSLSTWLYSIVYRTALDHQNYERRRRHDDIDTVELAGVADPAVAVVSILELASVLDELAPRDRAALMLTIGLGFSYAEVAEIVGEPQGTIASRVSRTRRRLERWEQR